MKPRRVGTDAVGTDLTPGASRFAVISTLIASHEGHAVCRMTVVRMPFRGRTKSKFINETRQDECGLPAILMAWPIQSLFPRSRRARGDCIRFARLATFHMCFLDLASHLAAFHWVVDGISGVLEGGYSGSAVPTFL